ncbi:MAG TPA: DUF120 domain-containing protein [Candidatus Saccharimonadales bacterium]|nr:DUF120 domain-containing protein [Candidatus Saccharimonadales bacterium]
MTRTIEITGTVSSGLARGKYFMSKRAYMDQMKAKLSFTPYPGTLNISVPEGETHKVRLLKQTGGILIKGFKEGERTFGDVTAFKARLMGTSCAVILPKLSKYSDRIEVISGERLRGKLKLSDGDKVTISIAVS